MQLCGGCGRRFLCLSDHLSRKSSFSCNAKLAAAAGRRRSQLQHASQGAAIAARGGGGSGGGGPRAPLLRLLPPGTKRGRQAGDDGQGPGSAAAQAAMGSQQPPAKRARGAGSGSSGAAPSPSPPASPEPAGMDVDVPEPPPPSPRHSGPGPGGAGSSGAAAAAAAGAPAARLTMAATTATDVLRPPSALQLQGQWGGAGEEVQRRRIYATGVRLTDREAHVLQTFPHLPGALLDKNIRLLKRGSAEELRFSNRAELQEFLVDCTDMVSGRCALAPERCATPCTRRLGPGIERISLHLCCALHPTPPNRLPSMCRS